MSTTIVERIAVILEGQANQFYATMDGALGKIKSLQAGAQSLGTRLSLAVTAPVTAMSAVGLAAFASFDEAMTKSTAIMSGVTEEQKKMMEDMATSLSEKTATSADKLAEGYYFLASAGMDAASATKALSTVNNFALAGAFDMARATEMLADSQTSLGLRMDDPIANMQQMARVSDVLVDAANASNASVEQFATALTTKSALALKSYNKEVEEGVAVLSVYADAGVKGANAGERLNILLRELTNRSRKNADEWAQLGVSVYDAGGNMRHVAAIVADLEKKTAGMTDEQKNATFAMLGFEAEAMDSIRPLLGLSDKILSYETRLKSAGGVTKDVSDKQMKSFSNQMAIMKNTMTNVAREIGMSLAPRIEFMNKVTTSALGIWKGLGPETRKYAIILVSIASAAGPVLLGFATFAALLPQITAGYAMLRTATLATAAAMNLNNLAMSTQYAIMNSVRVAANATTGAFRTMYLAILSPVGMIVAGIAAIGAAVLAAAYIIMGPQGFANAWDSSKKAVMNFVAASLGFMQHFVENMQILYVWLQSNWYTLLKDMLNATIAFTVNMTTNFGVAIQTMIKLLYAFVGWITIAVPAAFNQIFTYELLDIILTGIIQAIEYFQTFVSSLGKLFWAGLQTIYDTFNATFMAIINLTTKVATIIGKSISAILSGEMPDPMKMMSDFAAAALDEAGKIAGAAGAKIEAAASTVVDALAEEGKIIQDAFNQGASDMNFMNTATDIITDGIGQMKKPLDGFKSELETLPDFVFGKQGEAIEELTAGVNAGQNKLAEAIPPIADAAAAAALPVESMAKAAEDAAGGVEGVLKGTLESVLKVEDFLNKSTKGAAAATIAAKAGEAAPTAGKETSANADTSRYYAMVETLLTQIVTNTRQQFAPANLG